MAFYAMTRFAADLQLRRRGPWRNLGRIGTRFAWIVLALLVGSNLPFFGTVSANIMAFVKDLGSNGLVGLITLGIILWLFSGRKMA